MTVSDIDAQRGLIHIHRGKGSKDRFVRLPHSTLLMLRAHGVTQNNKDGLTTLFEERTNTWRAADRNKE